MGVEGLKAIPGIGEKTAEKIISIVTNAKPKSEEEQEEVNEEPVS